MAKITPQEFAEKWARRLTASTPDIQRGVNRVDVSPTEKAANKKDKMLTNLTQAVQSGKWEAGLRKVTLQDWKKQIIEKGIPRINQGVQGAQGQVADFAGQLLSYQDTIKQEIERMPDMTLEDNINRMTAWVRRMSQFKKS